MLLPSDKDILFTDMRALGKQFFITSLIFYTDNKLKDTLRGIPEKLFIQALIKMEYSEYNFTIFYKNVNTILKNIFY